MRTSLRRATIECDRCLRAAAASEVAGLDRGGEVAVL